jgi:hypothetical protein
VPPPSTPNPPPTVRATPNPTGPHATGRTDHISAGLADLLIRASRQHGGRLADYIPELAHVDPDRFGIAMTSVLGRSYRAGDENTFTIQSISKPFVYAMVIDELGTGGGRPQRRIRAQRRAVQRHQPRARHRSTGQRNDQRRGDRHQLDGPRHRRRSSGAANA